MRAIIHAKYGPPEVLQIVEATKYVEPGQKTEMWLLQLGAMGSCKILLKLDDNNLILNQWLNLCI